MRGGELALACDRQRALRKYRSLCGWLWIVLLGISAGHAQTCQSASDMDPAVRTALDTTAKRFFDLAARGDASTLQQNSIAAVASNFGGIETAVKDNQAAFSGAQASVRPPFVLTAEGSAPLERAEFLCGVFGKSGQTADSAVFMLHNLPPGKYAVVIVDARGGHDPRMLTKILQQMGTDWKLAGFYARPVQVNGHDATWFIQRARDFKAKGQIRNAWLYYHEALALSSPVDMMSTQATDKLYDEMQAVQPGDLPVNGSTVDVSAGAKTYRVTEVFPLAVGSDLDVVVKYQAGDVSNTAQTYQENMAVTKAVLAKYPEFREAFAGIIVRAVEPSGRDYGSLLAMKDVK
jgi:hypothetical protein